MKTSLFRADRKSGVLLETQFADWLRGEISRGRFPAGAPLPGIVELVRSCCVSTTTVRSALGRLADEGWVKPLRHVGSVVLKRGVGVRRQRVLLWEPGKFFCYYSSQIVSALRTEFLRGQNSATLMASSSPCNRQPLRQLEELLKEPWDLVISHGCGEGICDLMDSSGHPFVRVGNGERLDHFEGRNCKGCIEVLNGLALPDLVRRCASRNVQKVAQVHFQKGGYDITEMMRLSGIAVSTFRTAHLDTPEAVAKAGFGIVDSWFGRGRVKLPDLVLFTDDYVAQGGLIALKKHGVRIPEDVAVVSHANKGHGPVWEKPLTRLEMNPMAHAVVIAKAVRAFLRGHPFPEGITLGSVWKDGQTF